MAQTPNILNSIIKYKCPKCREGDLFVNKNTFKYKNFLDVSDNCPKCNQDFQIEAGFYLGAIFVSYALTIALTTSIFVAFAVFNIYSLVPFLITVGICLIITTPMILHVSRSIWIAMSVAYKSNAISDYEARNKN
jgi:uncharacterized protein (DUF983 family)